MKNIHLKISPSIIFLFLSIIVGGYIRISQALGSPFPLNDGGLFYTMTQNLIANGFRIPIFTTYNNLNIPFAYPPLAFYFTGLLSTLLGLNLLDVFRILPAVFSILAIPAFYFLAKALLSEEYQVMLATFIFALTPATFEWLIMGGGVTRSPAFFFALLTLLSIYRLYTRQKKLDILLTAILASITILLHPETAVDTAASALIFFLFFGRNKAGLVKSILVAIITILLTSPWWVTVLYNHGFSPFLAAGKTGWHNLQQLINLFRFDLTNEYDLKSIGVLGFIGLFFYLRRKKYFFPVLFLAIYITQPRSAAYFETPLFAIFASYSLLVILNVLNQYFRRNASSTNGDHPFSSLASKVLFALLTCQWVFSAFATVIVMFNTISILPADKIAFTWITSNTPSNSRFLVLTGDAPLTDPVSEWFPALTDRISVGTAQGYEWLTKYNFNDMLQRALDAQNCNDQSLDCVASWKNKYDMDFDYIYIRKTVSRNGLKQEPISSALEALLLKSDDYSLVYRSDQVVIFFKRT